MRAKEIINENYLRKAADSQVAPIGINVKTDKKAKRSYADLIVDGEKYYESRKGTSLMPFVGKTVSIIRTGNGPRKGNRMCYCWSTYCSK